MTAAELDELERRIHVALNCQCTSASVPVPALRKLIAIARSAEGLAESLEAVLSEYDQGQACVQARRELEGYRKVQP